MTSSRSAPKFEIRMSPSAAKARPFGNVPETKRLLVLRLGEANGLAVCVIRVCAPSGLMDDAAASCRRWRWWARSRCPADLPAHAQTSETAAANWVVTPCRPMTRSGPALNAANPGAAVDQRLGADSARSRRWSKSGAVTWDVW